MLFRSLNVSGMRRICGAQRIGVDRAKIVAIYANQAPASLQIDDGERFVLPSEALAWQALPAGAVLNCEASSAYLFAVPLSRDLFEIASVQAFSA